MKVVKIHATLLEDVEVYPLLTTRWRGKSILRFLIKKGEDNSFFLDIPIEGVSYPLLLVYLKGNELELCIEELPRSEEPLYRTDDKEKVKRILSFLDGKEEILEEEIKEFLKTLK